MSIQEQFVIMASEQDYGKLKSQLAGHKNSNEKLRKQLNAQKKLNSSLNKQLINRDMAIHQIKQQLKQRNGEATYLAKQMFTITLLFTGSLSECEKLKKKNQQMLKQITQLKSLSLDSSKIQSQKSLSNPKVDQLYQASQTSQTTQTTETSLTNQELHNTIFKMKQQLRLLAAEKQSWQKNYKVQTKSVMKVQQNKQLSFKSIGPNQSEQSPKHKEKTGNYQQQAKRYKKERDQYKKQYNQLSQTNDGLFKLNQDLETQIDKLKRQLKSLKSQNQKTK